MGGQNANHLTSQQAQELAAKPLYEGAKRAIDLSLDSHGQLDLLALRDNLTTLANVRAHTSPHWESMNANERQLTVRQNIRDYNFSARSVVAEYAQSPEAQAEVALRVAEVRHPNAKRLDTIINELQDFNPRGITCSIPKDYDMQADNFANSLRAMGVSCSTARAR